MFLLVVLIDPVKGLLVSGRSLSREPSAPHSHCCWKSWGNSINWRGRLASNHLCEDFEEYSPMYSSIFYSMYPYTSTRGGLASNHLCEDETTREGIWRRRGACAETGKLANRKKIYGC